MTEEEWLNCEDSQEMVDFLQGKGSRGVTWSNVSDVTTRKLRIFAGASFRRLAHLLPDDRQRKAIEYLEDNSAEAYARRDVTRGALHAYRRDVTRGALHAYLEAKELGNDFDVGIALYRELASAHPHAPWATGFLPEGGAQERWEQSRLLRCIFGPLLFHFVSVAETWKTSAVVILAQSIYVEEAFEKLSELADALQRAGCDDTRILGHCREMGPHVRNCWVIDLLLFPRQSEELMRFFASHRLPHGEQSSTCS